jgi:hypothetical protein
MKNFLSLLLISSLLLVGCAKSEEASTTAVPEKPAETAVTPEPIEESEPIVMLTADNPASMSDMAGSWTGEIDFPEELIEGMKQMMSGMAEAMGGTQDGKTADELKQDLDEKMGDDPFADAKITMELREDGTCTLHDDGTEGNSEESTWSLNDDGTVLTVVTPAKEGEVGNMMPDMVLGISEDMDTMQFAEAQMGFEMKITFTRD